MPDTIKSPFKFLDAYDKNDRDIFFGREAETLELHDRVFETNLVLLYGASGTGKTSLINCGLGNQFESTDWYPLFVRRKDYIIDSLFDELRKHAVRSLNPDTPLDKCVRSLYLDYFKPIYLIFDQFEELFILGTREEQTRFFELLRELLDKNLQCKVLLSMREEYIASLSNYEHVIPELFDNRLRVEAMSVKNLKEVIQGTVEAFEIDMEDKDSTTELIINNLRDKRSQIDLANLQVYLDRLYRLDVKRRGQTEKRVFDQKLVKDTGELADVLSAFLDEQLSLVEREIKDKFHIKQQGVPLNVLFELVTDNGTKQSMDVDVVKKSLKRRKDISAETVDYCIQRFKDMRILRELNE